jgi:hypothetical protein
MYRTGFSPFIIVIAAVVLCMCESVFAVNALSLHPYYEESGPGLDLWAGGESVIVPGKGLKDRGQFHLGEFSHVSKVFLLWSGETGEGAQKFQEVVLTPAGRKPVLLKADRVYRAGSSGAGSFSPGIYACIADMTPYYRGKGSYVIDGIRSDPHIQRRGEDQFAVAGYSAVVVYGRDDDRTIHHVRVFAGLDALSPGEMHSVSILENGTGLSLQKIAIIGGHGRKGNGSSNLLNGTGISQSEDWDGSSGHYWDVDVFDPVQVDRRMEQESGLLFTIDTVLQWIYPVSVAAVFKERGK